MIRLFAALLASEAFLAVATAAPVPKRTAPEMFLVQHVGLSFLGEDGETKERLTNATNGVLSPDGRWLACVEFDANPSRAKLVIRPCGRPGESATVPLVWDVPGMSGFLAVWSADNKRVLIGENRPGKGAFEYAYRVYELATEKLIELKLPDGHWVTGWSPDGKRFATTARAGDNNLRIALLNVDGSGKPEFITPENEVAYDARFSPIGGRILFMAGPKAPKGERPPLRLYAMDLSTKKRTVLDDPGETHGYCWRPDGSRIAYTWQRSLKNPAQVAERETLLITCDPDGKNRKTVTSRKYRVPENSSGKSSIVIFFQVLAWR
jgi:Tol biopolymer transport system component